MARTALQQFTPLPLRGGARLNPGSATSTDADMVDSRIENRRTPRPARRYALRREIAAALLFKVVALTLLYLAFFAPSHRRAVSSGDIAARFTASASIQGKH
jgi:hypothetical protein